MSIHFFSLISSHRHSFLSLSLFIPTTPTHFSLYTVPPSHPTSPAADSPH
ncbi:hypothetical protein LguiA_007075 [Lonicera macranthoides]